MESVGLGDGRDASLVAQLVWRPRCVSRRKIGKIDPDAGGDPTKPSATEKRKSIDTGGSDPSAGTPYELCSDANAVECD